MSQKYFYNTFFFVIMSYLASASQLFMIWLD